MAILNFNAQTVAPNSAFEPLPAGWYNVKITDSEMKPTKAGDGSFLALTMEVLDGQHAGRKVFTNLNLDNKNPVAVKIAYEQLSALCHVTGVIQCNESQQLHGIPFQAKLSVRPAGEYDASNEVKGFRDQYGRDPKDIIAGNAPAGGAAALGAPQPPTAPTAPTAAPTAPAAPAAPAAPSAPAPVTHDPVAAAEADGWIKHPSADGYHYKGQEVVKTSELVNKYPAPAAAPAAPAAPAVPAAPAAPSAAPAGAVPSWAAPKAA